MTVGGWCARPRAHLSPAERLGRGKSGECACGPASNVFVCGGGNDVFWKYSEAIFKYSRLNGQGIPAEGGVDPLLKLAKSFGVNAEKFEACVSAAETQKQVNDDLQDGAAAGITGTPGVILINHKSGRVDVLAGAVPIESLRDAVKNLLGK